MLHLAVGNATTKGVAQVGAVSKFGFVTTQQFFYCGGYYNVNVVNNPFVEQGAEIEAGFNYFFGENKRMRFWFGSSIAMNTINVSQLKVVYRPVIIGLSLDLIKVRVGGY